MTWLAPLCRMYSKNGLVSTTGPGHRRAGDHAGNVGDLAIGDGVFAVIEAEFDRELVVDEAADTDVVFRRQQVAAENIAPMRLVVAVNAGQGEIVAERGLRYMDIGRRVILLAQAE